MKSIASLPLIALLSLSMSSRMTVVDARIGSSGSDSDIGIGIDNIDKTNTHNLMMTPDTNQETASYDYREEIIVDTGYDMSSDGTVRVRSEPIKMVITIGDIPGWTAEGAEAKAAEADAAAAAPAKATDNGNGDSA
eukprot:jgi/Psemu1/310961/fgenesh1_kg.702_\